MSTRAIILLILLILLIMFAPLLLAEGLERFFGGLGAMIERWAE